MPGATSFSAPVSPHAQGLSPAQPADFRPNSENQILSPWLQAWKLRAGAPLTQEVVHGVKIKGQELRAVPDKVRVLGGRAQVSKAGDAQS